MKTHEPLKWLLWVVTLIATLPAGAEETAVVKDGRINVRGQPSLVGEVITQLQKGEKVVILEEITVAKPKTNEPVKWARIQMPQNTPVWVFSSFIDPASKSVRVTRVNLRAGPGENYSVIGRLNRGTAVNEIRRVEEWMEIETPSDAYAFVAADLLTKTGAAPAKVEPSPAKVETGPAKVETGPAKVETGPAPIPPSSPPVVQHEMAAPLPQKAPQESPPMPGPAQMMPVKSPGRQDQSPAPVMQKAADSKKSLELQKAPEPKQSTANPVVSSHTPPPPPMAPVVKSKTEPPPLKRIIRREGLVRSSVSIQAPTYYELLSPENHKTINFLHTDKLDVKLNDYRGRTIIVTGEEAIDPRWPKIPVLEVETLELIP